MTYIPVPHRLMPSTDVIHKAVAAALSAAESSGGEVRELAANDELEAATQLLAAIWNGEGTALQLQTSLLKALSKTGNYVAGAFVDGRLVGAGVAFFAAPTLRSLHSHIAGIRDEFRARSVGYALKLHQRAWALSHDIPKVTWTFDPLVRRNAYFNLVKLSARAVEYLPDFYGAMPDYVNAGDESDRVLIEWDLLASDVVSLCDGPRDTRSRQERYAQRTVTVLGLGPDGAPQRGRWQGPFGVVAIPPDIEQLRLERSPLARQWRLAVREVLGEAMADGATIVGFRRTEGYILAALDA